MHKQIRIRLDFFILIISAIAVSHAAENYATWEHSQKILLNTTPIASGGAGVTSNVLRFPVLIRLTSDNFRYFNQTNDGGSDIRFATNSGKHLAYQIERWADNSNDNDTAEIWVALDTVQGNTISQRLIMYWGNVEAVDSSNSYAVFDSSNGFTGTYHLTDTKQPEDSVEDASSFKHTGINRESIDTTSGLIGHARYFDGTGFFGLGQLPNRPIGTLSCWVRLNSPFDATTAKTLGIWCIKQDDGNNASLCLRGTDYYAGSNNATGAFQTKCEFNNTGVYLAGKTRSFDANRWYYVAWSWGNGNESLSLNGTVESDTALSYTVGSNNAGWDVVGTGLFDIANISDTTRHFIGMIDEFRMDNVKRSSAWINLSYQNQKPSQSLVATNGVFKWDTRTLTGIQPGNGSWGTDVYWTLNEMLLTTWPGRSYSAQFGGTAGTYTITVDGTQQVDSIAFVSSTFTLTGDTLDFGIPRGAIFLSPGVTANIDATIKGTGGLSMSKSTSTLYSRLNLNGANTYTGITTIYNDIWCNVATLANGGTACSIGKSSGDAANIVLDKGVLRYTGTTDANTDRLFTVTNNGACIYASGTGAMNFTATDAVAFTGSGNRAIEFGGLYVAGSSIFSPIIGDGTGGKTAVTKTGDVGNAWVFTAAHTYTGATTVSNGILVVNGSLAAGSAVTIAGAAALAGTGTVSGSVDASGTIAPGYNGPGTLTTGALTLHSTSVLNFELGTESDALHINGNCTLDGTLNITGGAGFAPGNYRLLSWSGTLTDQTVEIGTLPSGVNGTLALTDSTLSITFSEGLIKSEPSDTTVPVGQKAVFSVTTDAISGLTYTWQRYPGDSVGNAASYSINTVSIADTNAQFRCIVKDSSLSSDTSRWATLTVIDVPHITAHSHDTALLVGEAVTFSITVKDTAGCHYTWRKAGDTTTLSSVSSYEIPSALESSSGGYYCIVTNTAGTVRSDTIHLVISYPKPVPGFSFTPSSGTFPLEVSFVDTSSGIITYRSWSFGDGTSDSANQLKHIYTTSGYFTVKLVVSGPGGKDSATVTNAVTVTGTKSNPLTLEGTIVKQRNVRITINNVNQVDTAAPEPWCDSIGLWITAGELPRNSTEATLLKRYPRSALNGSAIVDTVTFPSTDSIYGVIAGIFWGDGTISDFLVINGMTVDFRDKSARQNPLRITASHLGEMDVRIVLSNVDKIDTASPAPVCDSIGIWILPDSLPKNYNAASLVATYPCSLFSGSLLIDTLHMPKSDSVYGIMTGLFWDDGSIGDFLPENGTMIDLRDTTTTTVSDSILSSRLHLTSLAFDSIRAALRVSWCIDSLKSNEDLEVGISYATDRYPDKKTGDLNIIALASCTDTTVGLTDALLFDTLYFVRLFIRRPGDDWNGGGDQTRDTIRTGSFYCQVITYFDTTRQSDTVSAFNSHIILWKDSTFDNTTILVDTLQKYAVKIPDGFIAAGIPVKFILGVPGQPFFIGFKVTLPETESIHNVRIYRDSAGALLVDYSTMIDSVNGIVYVRTSDPRQPFIPLLDKKPPRVKFITNTNTIAHAENDIVDSITINDNVFNVKWEYLYSSADRVPTVRDSGRLNDTTATKRLFISKSDHVISSDYGVRAFLVVHDGVYGDTFNISRSVYRKNSDPTTTEGKLWQPVYPTAVIDKNDPDSLIISGISPEDGYDPKNIRLFRWVATESNKNQSEKWVEYDTASESVKKLFTVIPGRLLWLKTRKNVTISLGSAHTFSLKDTFSIKLPPKQFTDFGMPFRFGVTLRDIFASSDKKASDIRFFIWKEDEETDRYKCTDFYSPNLPEHSDPSVIMKFEAGNGYCLYNPLGDTVELRIPPTLGVADSTPKSAKKAASKNWNIRFLAQTADGYTFPSLYCGYTAGVAKSNYPVPPTFEKIQIQFFDRATGTRQAHYINDDAADGIVQELQIVNTSDSASEITYRFESAGALPDQYTVDLYDFITRQFHSGGTVSVPAHSTKSFGVLVGDNNLHERFLVAAGGFTYALRRIYPNPARSVVNISFSVPMGSQEKLRLMIFDLHGRKIWENRINRLLTPGHHTSTWNGCGTNGAPVGAGMYVLRLSVVNQQGAAVRRFDRTITWLP